jgi:translation initiation factor IF-3
LGIVTRSEALQLAEEAGVDLVEIAPTADPPVCRIMDYGKFKYEQAKREKESRKGAKHSELREVRMRVKIDDHDIDFKARTARKLLADGDKVKVSVMFRAREITHPEVGRELIDRFYEKIRDVSTMERPPAMEGRMLSMVLTPGVKREKAPAAPRAEARSEAPAAAPVAEPVEASAVGTPS